MWVYLWDTNLVWSSGGGEYDLCILYCYTKGYQAGSYWIPIPDWGKYVSVFVNWNNWTSCSSPLSIDAIKYIYNNYDCQCKRAYIGNCAWYFWCICYINDNCLCWSAATGNTTIIVWC